MNLIILNPTVKNRFETMTIANTIADIIIADNYISIETQVFTLTVYKNTEEGIFDELDSDVVTSQVMLGKWLWRSEFDLAVIK